MFPPAWTATEVACEPGDFSFDVAESVILLTPLRTRGYDIFLTCHTGYVGKCILSPGGTFIVWWRVAKAASLGIGRNGAGQPLSAGNSREPGGRFAPGRWWLGNQPTKNRPHIR